MLPSDNYFDDLAVGDRVDGVGITLTESAIVDFALVYDPQPFHIDATAAAAGPFGGLAASGFQTLGLTFRSLYQTGWLTSASLGGPGIDELRWLKPVRPGETLRAVGEVKELTPSRSKPDRGVVKLATTTFDRQGEAAMTLTFIIILKRRRDG